MKYSDKPKIPHSVLYPRENEGTLVLKLFRGEPAITKLDWHFTSCHRSSHAFAAATGSGLHSSFDKLHPAHDKLAWLRVPRPLSSQKNLRDALLILGFPLPPPETGLDKERTRARWLILQ